MGQALPSVFPSMFPSARKTQATRHARRVYVGGLPPMANEQSVATFFSQVMAVVGGNIVGPGDAVVNVYINQEKQFAFVEMRTIEEANNGMALDGINYEVIVLEGHDNGIREVKTKFYCKENVSAEGGRNTSYVFGHVTVVSK